MKKCPLSLTQLLDSIFQVLKINILVESWEPFRDGDKTPKSEGRITEALIFHINENLK